MFKVSRIQYLIINFGFSVPLENFSLIWRRQMAGEGLQMLTFVRLSLPFRSEGSSTCHTYCDTGESFISHLRGPVTLTPVAERLAVKLSLLILITLVCPGDRTPISRLRGECCTTKLPRWSCALTEYIIWGPLDFFKIGIAFWLCIPVLPF